MLNGCSTAQSSAVCEANDLARAPMMAFTPSTLFRSLLVQFAASELDNIHPMEDAVDPPPLHVTLESYTSSCLQTRIHGDTHSSLHPVYPLSSIQCVTP